MEDDLYRYSIGGGREVFMSRSAGMPCGGDGYVLSSSYAQDLVGVRPIVEIEPNCDIVVCDRFVFGGHTFTMVTNNIALCDDNISVVTYMDEKKIDKMKGCYDDGKNISYKFSDVKKCVDEWFSESLKKENMYDTRTSRTTDECVWWS